MTPFEELLLQALNEINLLYKNCVDEKQKKIIENDMNVIYRYLDPELFQTKNNDNNLLISKKDIVDTIVMNKEFFSKLRKIHFVKSLNKNENLEIFNSFINNDEFKLKSIYEDVLSYNGICFSKVTPFYLGCNIYFESIKKNYIDILVKDNIRDYSILCHELGHAKQFLNSNINKNYYSVFSETYSVFLELMFIEYIKKYGLYKESYNIKLCIFNNIINKICYLYNSVDGYFNGKNIDTFNYTYKLFISNLLAIHLYNLYLINSTNCLQILDVFNKKFKVVDDIELLKSIGLDFDIFKNYGILKNYSNNLCEEKKLIKKL